MLYTDNTALHDPSPSVPHSYSTWWKRSGPGHALQGREDCLVLNNVRNNENFHHAATNNMYSGNMKR